jgi:D-alanine-D-alanine ligase
VIGRRKEVSEKKRLGVIFGGRSGEHEVSLMSARSILSAVNRETYEVIEIGITHDGAWLVGEKVLDSMLNGSSGQLSQATILPDPSQCAIFRIDVEPDRGGIEQLQAGRIPMC